MTIFHHLTSFRRDAYRGCFFFVHHIFEACALYFQHVMMLAPCVMCIYERVAMMGIGGAAIIGLIAPNNALFRWLGLIGWGLSSYKGLMLAMQHVDYQFNPSPFATCDLLSPSQVGLR